jgi:hypothetical protein
LEAEISRERFDADRFHIGQKVGVRFRRWQLYPGDAPRLPSGGAVAAGSESGAETSGSGRLASAAGG